MSRIFSSSSARAIETAKIVEAFLGISYEVVSTLRERDYGPFDGLPREELLTLRQSLGFSNIDPTQDWTDVEGVESDECVWKRVKPLFEELIASQSADTALFVTHAGVIKAVLHSIFAIPPERKLCFKIPNCSFVVLRSVQNYLEMTELCPNPCVFTGAQFENVT